VEPALRLRRGDVPDDDPGRRLAPGGRAVMRWIAVFASGCSLYFGDSPDAAGPPPVDAGAPGLNLPCIHTVLGGRFSPAPTATLMGTHACAGQCAIAVVDLDSDGRDDIVLVHDLDQPTSTLVLWTSLAH